MDVVTANQLIAAYPGIERDLAVVYVWAGGKEPIMQRSVEKVTKFAAQAQRLLDTFTGSTGVSSAKATRDRRQANRIAGLLRKGGKAGVPWPIFVDKRNVIRKGHHRIVAYFVLDYPTVEVIHIDLK